MKKSKTATIEVRGTVVSILTGKEGDYISLTDMLRAKDGEFFISDWLRNRNTVEFLGIWESVFNPDFNYGEFAIIRSQAGLNSYAREHWTHEGENPPVGIILCSAADTALAHYTLDTLPNKVMAREPERR